MFIHLHSYLFSTIYTSFSTFSLKASTASDPRMISRSCGDFFILRACAKYLLKMKAFQYDMIDVHCKLDQYISFICVT